MSLFDNLVSKALQNNEGVTPLRVVVEKELLHHDILREMSTAGLLKKLTFIGGTCLRACYGSNRLSENLDFTGGHDFSRKKLTDLSSVLVNTLQSKYNLNVEVSEPIKDKGNVDTWKLKVTTRPQDKHLASQRIHIDVCAIPSYDQQPMTIRNHYGIEMGTSGLITRVQSLSEILADKMVAFALRPNRIKNRDLWDIGWLKQQNVSLPLNLLPKKVADHLCSSEHFSKLLRERSQQLEDDPSVHQGFIFEMKRFLPPNIVSGTVEKKDFWIYLVNLIKAESVASIQAVKAKSRQTGFEM